MPGTLSDRIGASDCSKPPCGKREGCYIKVMSRYCSDWLVAKRSVASTKRSCHDIVAKGSHFSVAKVQPM